MMKIVTITVCLFLAAITLANPATKPSTQPVVKETLITQGSHDIAYNVPAKANFYVADTRVSAGGIIKAVHGAYSIYCENVSMDGPISGGGNYPFICATEPVQSFVLDNTKRRNDPATANDDDVINGAETGIRLMGRGGSGKIIGVNLRCDTHDFWDPTGIFRHTPLVKQVFWKDIMALRDFDTIEVSHCRVIGPWRLGEQKNTALTHQHVNQAYIHDCQLTDLGTIDTPGTVGKVIYRNNAKITYKLDGKGKVVVTVVGKWPDRN